MPAADRPRRAAATAARKATTAVLANTAQKRTAATSAAPKPKPKPKAAAKPKAGVKKSTSPKKKATPKKKTAKGTTGVKRGRPSGSGVGSAKKASSAGKTKVVTGPTWEQISSDSSYDGIDAPTMAEIKELQDAGKRMLQESLNAGKTAMGRALKERAEAVYNEAEHIRLRARGWPKEQIKNCVSWEFACAVASVDGRRSKSPAKNPKTTSPGKKTLAKK